MNLAKYFENVIKVLCCIFIFSNFGFSQVENDEVKSFLSRENRGLKATDIEDFEISSYHISAPSSLKHIYFHQRYKGTLGKTEPTFILICHFKEILKQAFF